jgi:hypothetical protein
MTTPLEVPKRVRDSWAAEVEADRKAVEVEQAKLDAREARAAEVALKLPAARDQYIAARTEAERLIPLLEHALRVAAEARIEYTALHSQSLNLELDPGVRIPGLARGETLAKILALGVQA